MCIAKCVNFGVKHIANQACSRGSKSSIISQYPKRKRQEGPLLAGPSCLVQILGTSGFVMMLESSDTCSSRDVG